MMNPGISRSSSFSQESYDTALSGYSADTESSRLRGSQASPPSRLPSLERNPNASEALPQENELPFAAPDSLLAEPPPTIGNSALQEIETSLGHVATNLNRIQENAPPQFQEAEMRGLAHELIKPHNLILQSFKKHSTDLPLEAAESFSAPLRANLISLNNLNSVASSEIPGQVTQAFNAACDAVKFLRDHLPAEEPRHSEGMPQAGAVAALVEEHAVPLNIPEVPLDDHASMSTLTGSDRSLSLHSDSQTTGTRSPSASAEAASIASIISSLTDALHPPVGNEVEAAPQLVEGHEIVAGQIMGQEAPVNVALIRLSTAIATTISRRNADYRLLILRGGAEAEAGDWGAAARSFSFAEEIATWGRDDLRTYQQENQENYHDLELEALLQERREAFDHFRQQANALERRATQANRCCTIS